MSKDTLTITDNRTGKTCEIPIEEVNLILAHAGAKGTPKITSSFHREIRDREEMNYIHFC